MKYKKYVKVFTDQRSIFYVSFLLILSTVIFITGDLFAQTQTSTLPDISLKIGSNELSSDGNLSSSVKIVILITVLSFAPAMILTMTCFTRIAIVLGMTRTAIGTQSAPPNSIITGLSLFLTFSIMGPIFMQMHKDGIEPYLENRMSQSEAVEKTLAPLKKFLISNAREKDIALFLDITKTAMPDEPKDLPFMIAVSSFVLGELNTAFQIGFLIALPFLVLDMVVSSVLTAMSMITLPPVVISLPLKLMLFVIVDGWHLIISSLVKTYTIN
jgi:flagellar biosynthesis protein FliP